MADVQKQFEEYHSKIRTDYGMSQTLRKKRDIVVEKIKKHMRDNNLPVPTQLLQGSYKMKTGVKPIADIEYDIDVGLRFDIHIDEYTAGGARAWVLEAIGTHTMKVESKNPCIRICYEAGYHLDIVSYAVWEDSEGIKQYRLAHKNNGWTPADPPGLLNYVDAARLPFKGTEDSETQTDQFRRCVRSLRRWADELRPIDDDDCKPSGIALVLLSIQNSLTPTKFLDDRSDDRKALENLSFTLASTVGRLQANKPTPGYEDILAGFSDDEMEQLKAELSELNSALVFAGSNIDPVETCKRLQEVFGEDFPVPEPKDTAKKTSAPAIITSSASA